MMKEGQKKRRGFEIVMDVLSKYKNRLTKSERKQLISALERQLIIQKKGIIFLIDSEKTSMTSLSDIGSYEFGWDRLEESKRQRRKPIEIISDAIIHNHTRLSNRDYESLIEEVKNLR